MISTDQWSTIRGLVDWLDRENGRSDAEIGLRILKLSEEVGEVAQAWIGVQGQNPRKGVTHTRADVQDELCDVIVTAAVALASLVDNPSDVLDTKLAKIAARSQAVTT
ncbi:MazG-like family protein [Streptomyces sp. NPDC002755]